MKKIALLLSFLLCAFFSFAQFPNNASVSNTITLYEVKGALLGGKSVMLPVIDTLNNPATIYKGALTLRPQDNLVYYSDGVYWHTFVSTNNGWIVDSIYVERPIAVKIGTSGATAGKQIIYFLKESGIIAGGVPFSTGCRTLTMPPSIYNINFNQYSSLSTNLVIDTSHATLNRQDRIVGDTFGIVTVLKGTASALGLPPPFDPSSQFSLALISIPAASTCTPPSASTKIIYDQNVGVAGGEYDATTVGAIAVDFDNLDNPYHLTKAAFISTYVDSSQIVFTNTGLQDTVTSTSAIVIPKYLNNRFINSMQGEFFLNGVSVSNNIILNSYFNTLDTGQYQITVIPLTAFGFSSNYFNRFDITFRGYDTSGAGGLYLDYIQIQKGFTYTATGLTLTTNTSTGVSTLIDNVLNIPPAWSLVGNIGTTSSNFIGTTDSVQFRIRVNNTPYGFLDANITSLANAAWGYHSLYSNTSGGFNTVIGSASGTLNTTGGSNTVVGSYAFTLNVSGGSNTAIGTSALRDNTSSFNTAVGTASLRGNTTGTYNTAIGGFSSFLNTTGHRNVAVGLDALRSNTTGAYNTIIGEDSWRQNEGSYNTTLGNRAGYQATGDSNILIGYQAGYSSTGNGKLYIANKDTPTPLVYGEFATPALTFGGTITLRDYTSLHNGASTDSVLTINRATGVINVRDAASFGSTLQQATDASIAAGDNPYINAHNNNFIIDSTDNFIANGSNGFVLAGQTATSLVNFGASSNPPVLDATVNELSGGSTYEHKLVIQPTVIELTGATNFVNSHTHLRINHADTLLTPPTYVYVPDNDTVKVYPFPTGGGWGTTGTIATLTGNSILDLGGNAFGVEDVGLGTVLNLSLGLSQLTAFNDTDDGNETTLTTQATPTEATFELEASFNDGIKIVGISALADASTSTLTFTGIPIFDTQFTPANSTDAAYPIKTLTISDTFLYYRKSDGTWVKIAWTAF